jgi:MFS family permease
VVCSALVMIGLVYGLTRAGEAGWGDPQVLVALAVAVLALVALVPVERRAAHPVVPFGLVAGARATPYLGMLLMPACMIGFFYVSVLVLRDLRHLDALQTGLAYLPFAAAVVVGGRVVPRLIPPIGERATVALGVVLGVAGTVLFGLLVTGSPIWLGVLLPCLVIGLGPGMFFTATSNRIMTDAPASDAGSAAALLQSLQQLGGAVGVAALTTVYAGHAAQGPERAGPTAVLAAAAFGIVLLLVVLGTRAFPGRPPTAEPVVGRVPAVEDRAP